jgi:DNA-binding response OmpR family regulator
MNSSVAPTVLIVDPEPLIVESIAMALATRGFRVLQAVTRGVALRIVSAESIHVLIAHGHLQGDSSPFQFADEAGASHPLMAIVAVTSDALSDHPFVPGRARILPKPFDLDGLLLAIGDAQSLAGSASA